MKYRKYPNWVIISIRKSHFLTQGVLKIEPGTPTGRLDTENQQATTIDLVITAPALDDRVSEATIADDSLTTGSDHETLTWEIATEEDFRREVSERWRTRLPDDPEEEKEWKEKWMSSKGTTELPISEVIQRFGIFFSNELGTKKLHPRSKKWWTREINEAHAVMGKARADLRNNRSSPAAFKGARKKWFRTVRKAKRTCWETFLQEGKEEDIWRAVTTKQPPAPVRESSIPLINEFSIFHLSFGKLLLNAECGIFVFMEMDGILWFLYYKQGTSYWTQTWKSSTSFFNVLL
jgi:hypothetical protein